MFIYFTQLDLLKINNSYAEACKDNALLSAIGAKKMTKAPPRKTSPKKAAKRTANDSDSDYVPPGAKKVTRAPRKASTKKASPKKPAENAKRKSGSDSDSEADCMPLGTTKNGKRIKKTSEASDEEYTPPSSCKTKTTDHSSDASDDFVSESEVWRKPKRRASERRESK